MEPQTSRGTSCLGRLFLWGVAVLGIGFLCLLFVNPYWINPPCGKRRVFCPANLKQVGLGLLMYCHDYDERFPPFREWSKRISPYVKNQDCFYCPSGGRGPDAKYYAAFAPLELRFLEQIDSPGGTPMLYDSTRTTPSPYDPLLSLPEPERHDEGNYVAYVDGHTLSQKNRYIREQGLKAFLQLRGETLEKPTHPSSQSP